MQDARGERRLRGIGVDLAASERIAGLREAKLDIFDAVGIDTVRFEVATQHDVEQRADAGHADGLALKIGHLLYAGAFACDQNVARQRVDRAAGEDNEIEPGIIGLQQRRQRRAAELARSAFDHGRDIAGDIGLDEVDIDAALLEEALLLGDIARREAGDRGIGHLDLGLRRGRVSRGEKRQGEACGEVVKRVI